MRKNVKIEKLEEQLKTVIQNAEYWENLYNGQIQARRADNQRHFESVTLINKRNEEALLNLRKHYEGQIANLTKTAQDLLCNFKHEGDKRIIEAERDTLGKAFQYLADAVAIGAKQV